MKLILTLFCLFLTAFLFSQSDPIKSYLGIPIITYGQNITDNSRYNFNNIDSAGIFAIQVVNLTEPIFSGYLTNKKFLILPEQKDFPDYINYYTKARYTVWKAGGTDLADGKATLFHDSSCGTDGNMVWTNASTAHNSKIISGPSYTQEVNYSWLDTITIKYSASFNLKREYLSPQLPAPTDTLCLLLVTTSKISVDPDSHTWKIFWTYGMDTLILFNSSIPVNNTWLDTIMNYSLNLLPDSVYHGYSGNSTRQKTFVDNVEFQVIWKGDASKVRLYVDKVTLSDQRGRDLHFSSAKNNILSQATGTQNYHNRLAGWLAVDEPGSIDEYEPIRIVDSILNNTSSSKKLWIAFWGGWNGRYGDGGNNFSSTDKLIGIDEFMRHVKHANVWVNFYLYDYPYKSNPLPYPFTDMDFKVKNISVAADSLYTRFNDASKLPGCSLYWGASIQTGKYFDGQDFGGVVNYREIIGSELLYQTNLALLYGAKVISPWLYFGWNILPNYDYTGLANYTENYSENDKYITLKNILAPKLNGLFGKTIKTLFPAAQYVGSKGINIERAPLTQPPSHHLIPGYIDSPNCLDYIKPYNNIAPVNYYIDYGFFSDHSNDSTRKYFMVINRYYSRFVYHEIGLKTLRGFTNWKLTHYTDSVSITLHVVGDTTHFYDTIHVGDAGLYSVMPVVKYGGEINYDETISGSNILLGEMTINNAVLTISGTYNIYKNINVLGEFIANPGATLNFHNGTSLFAYGIIHTRGATLNFYGDTTSNVGSIIISTPSNTDH
jgi:hypothetical protein